MLAGLALLATAAAATAGAMLYEPIHARAALVEMKAMGRLPGVSWFDLLDGLRHRHEILSKAIWTTGPVQMARGDSDGPCPVLWDTPFGQIHGRYEDERDLESLSRKYMHVGHGVATGVLPVFEPGDVVFETGAWIGLFTRVAFNHGVARVIALEPVPANVECLRITYAQEIADGRLTIIEVAAWSEPAELELQREAVHNPWGSTKGYNVVEKGELRVRGVTIDSVVEQLGLDRLDLINMDIEGSERYALAGARETILRFAPQIVACLHHKPDDDPAVPDVVRGIRPEYNERRDELHVRFHD